MNVSLSKIFSAAVNLCIAASVLNSCVNEAYDLNNVDGTAVIFKDAAMPIGNIEALDVSKLIATDDASVIAADPVSGDFSFRFNGTDVFSESLVIPTFEIPFTDGNSNHQTLTFDSGDFSGLDGTLIPQEIIEFHREFSRAFKIEDSHLLPHEVHDVNHVELDMDIEYIFKVNTGCAYVKPGFVMDFPDWMVVQLVGNTDNYSIEDTKDNKNVICLKKEIKLVAGTPFIIDLKVVRIDFPEGSIVDGGLDENGKDCKKVWINPDSDINKIKIEGDFYINTMDFPIIPDYIEVDMNMLFSDFDVTAANVSLGMDFIYDGQTIAMDKYPEFLTAEGVVFDIYDAFLKFDFVNSLPLQLEMNAEFEAYKNSVMTETIHLGDDNPNGTCPILIPAESGKQSIVFSKREHEGTIRLEKLGNILSSLPDKIKVAHVCVSSSHDYIDIIPGTEYDCSLGYELYAPLAFGPDFRFKYDLATEGLSLDLEGYDIRKATVTLNVTNSIPLNFSLAAKALDEYKSTIEDLQVEVVGQIASGDQGHPVTSSLEIQLTSSDKPISFKSLALTLFAEGPDADHLGIALNEAQSLKIDNMSLRLPDGVTVDLNTLFQ